MRASIPNLRDSIKEAAMKDLKDFLENVRKFSPKIGEHAMRHTAHKLNFDPLLGLDNDYVSSKKRQVMAPQPNPFTGMNLRRC